MVTRWKAALRKPSPRRIRTILWHKEKPPVFGGFRYDMSMWGKELTAAASAATTCPTATHAAHRGRNRLAISPYADRRKDGEYTVSITTTGGAGRRVSAFGHGAQHLKFFLAGFAEILVQRHDALPNYSDHADSI